MRSNASSSWLGAPSSRPGAGRRDHPRTARRAPCTSLSQRRRQSARVVPGCAPLLSSARTPPTSRRNNQPLAAGLRAAQPRRVPEAPPPAARPYTPPGLRAPRPPAGPRWMLCNSAAPRLLPAAHWLPETRATGPESHWGARRDPALPPLRPPRPTPFSHPRCEGRGNWEEKGRGGLWLLKGTCCLLAEKQDADWGEKARRALWV